MLPLTGSTLDLISLPTDQEFIDNLNRVLTAGGYDIHDYPAPDVCEREQPDGREIDEEPGATCSTSPDKFTHETTSTKDEVTTRSETPVSATESMSEQNENDDPVNDSDIGPYVAMSQYSDESDDYSDEEQGFETNEFIENQNLKEELEDDLVVLPVAEKPSYISVISSSQIVSKSKFF